MENVSTHRFYDDSAAVLNAALNLAAVLTAVAVFVDKVAYTLARFIFDLTCSDSARTRVYLCETI